MDTTKCVLLCLCHLIIGSYAGLTIEKCVWNDKACLKSSSQKAIPDFAKGLPEYGVSSIDPMHIDSVTINEGGLNIVFKDTILTGPKNCQVVDVERNIEENWLKFSTECPIDISGKYTASGKLFVTPVEGEGSFHIKSDKVFLDIKVDLSLTDGADGQKHWKLGKYEHSFIVKEKASIKLENLFNGDEEKSAAVHAILDQSWEQIIATFGKPFVGKTVELVVDDMKHYTDAVPASELEL